MAGLRILLCGAANLSKIWSACSQREVQYKKLTMKSGRIFIYNFTFAFLRTLIITRKMYNECSSQRRLECHYLYCIFTRRMSSVMYVVIDKQLVTFQNCFAVLSRICQGQG